MYTQAKKPSENNKRTAPSRGGTSMMKNGKEPALQFKDNRPQAVTQRKWQEMTNNGSRTKEAAHLQSIQKKSQIQTESSGENNTGLSDNLKSGIENLSGYSMDDVKVHYNSDKPAQLNAHAYAQGTDIHVASGQEKHLPYEAWHVVQQKQGRVRPTMQFNGAQINDSTSLESEATVMGQKAMQRATANHEANQQRLKRIGTSSPSIQRVINLNLLQHTANDLYYTALNGGPRLISVGNAAPPEPRSLFAEQTDSSTAGDVLHIWTSRSKLADKDKLNGTTQVRDEEDNVINDLMEVKRLELAQIRTEATDELNDQQGDRGLRIATIGMNDCLGYASTLQVLIAKYAVDRQGMVGTLWKHDTDRATGATFPYHGATVVAQDPPDAVTLEAHAGQQLTVPIFHIRVGGKVGFEQANIATGLYTPNAQEKIITEVRDLDDTIELLKDEWNGFGPTGTSSAVLESPARPAPQQNSNAGKWMLLAATLGALVVGIVALNKYKKE